MGIRIIHVKDFKKEPWQVYCGRSNLRLGFRSSPLANPYYLQREEDRGKIVEKFRAYFERLLDGREAQYKCEAAKEELVRLKEIHDQEGQLELACFCSPKRCHCDVIKEHLNGCLQDS